MTRQITNHILLIEPAVFYSNPETRDTNVYQIDNQDSPDTVFEKAVSEFYAFRNCLVSRGVHITTVKGHPDCPDHIFPNWASTHPDGRLVFYPMLNANRQAERTSDILCLLKRHYDLSLDIRDEENNGRYLESTGSLVMDHAHKIAYAALSARTTESLALEWADKMGYELITFDTQSHTGKPVYHTDLVMFIGETFAAICAECITDEAVRASVVQSLQEHREVILLSKDQMKGFCGNALNVRGGEGKTYLVMSAHGQSLLTEAQKMQFLNHIDEIIGTDISTIETYGGGSARCLMMELF